MKNIHNHLSEFLSYLATSKSSDCERLPSLAELSQELGISIASLREQMEVARAIGLIEVKPRVGIRHLPYSFRPAVQQSLNYAVAVDPGMFSAYSDLRNHVEAAYWYKAVGLLNVEDFQYLQGLIRKAFEKLNGSPIQIPHSEHRELHLSIYRRMDNPFVIGILEAYWDLYEEAGLDLYTDLEYLQNVWHYHQKMVEDIVAHDFDAGYQALLDHINLLFLRTNSIPHQTFE